MRLCRWSAIALAAGGLSATVATGQAQRAPAPRPAPVTPMPARVILANTQALFNAYVRDNKMPGIVGAFGIADLPTIFVSAGRIADAPTAPRAGPDSLWRVYSMTKPVTATAAMILLQEGKLKLDQPVGDFIPGFKSMRVLTDPDTSLASVPAVRPVTIRMLLTHTAGLGYNIVTKGPLLKEYERLGILPAEVNRTVEAKMRAARPASLKDFADRVATLPLVAQPGTKWSYSIGLDVMGRVIEVASGMPFDTFVQRRIFAPLRLTSSFWTVPAADAGRLATNYVFVGANRVPIDPGATSVFLDKPSFPYGGAGLVMSARDYDRFLHMLQDEGSVDGTTVLQPEVARTMMSNLLPDGVTFNGFDGKGLAQGFGAGGSVAIAGADKGTYGWGGAAGTLGWVNPYRRDRGTVMVNYFPAEQWPLRSDVRKALLADQARLPR